jgi:hypothetical protein
MFAAAFGVPTFVRTFADLTPSIVQTPILQPRVMDARITATQSRLVPHQTHDCERVGPCFAQASSERVTQGVKGEVSVELEQRADALLLLTQKRRLEPGTIRAVEDNPLAFRSRSVEDFHHPPV